MRTKTIAAAAAIVTALAAASTTGALASTKHVHASRGHTSPRAVVIPGRWGAYDRLYAYQGASWPRCTYPTPFYFANNCTGDGFAWGH